LHVTDENKVFVLTETDFLIHVYVLLQALPLYVKVHTDSLNILSFWDAALCLGSNKSRRIEGT
jgi:hypothetical protein